MMKKNVSNIPHLDEWKRHTYTNTHTHTRARAFTHTQGAASHVLVSGVSPEGAVDRHFGISKYGATAQDHVTNFLIRLYSNVADVLHGGAIKFVPSHKTSFYKQEKIFLKRVLSLQIVLKKTAGKPRSDRIYQNRNVDRNAYRKNK